MDSYSWKHYFWNNTIEDKGVHIFPKDGFGIKWPLNVDMPLNKETKLNPQILLFFYKDGFSIK